MTWDEANNSRGGHCFFLCHLLRMESTPQKLPSCLFHDHRARRSDAPARGQYVWHTRPPAAHRYHFRQHVRHRIRQHGPVPGPHRVRPARHRLPPRGRPGTVRTPVRGGRGGPDPQARRARCLRPAQRAGCKYRVASGSCFWVVVLSVMRFGLAIRRLIRPGAIYCDTSTTCILWLGVFGGFSTCVCCNSPYSCLGPFPPINPKTARPILQQQLCLRLR